MSKTLFNQNTFNEKNVKNSNSLDKVNVADATIENATITNLTNTELQTATSNIQTNASAIAGKQDVLSSTNLLNPNFIDAEDDETSVIITKSEFGSLTGFTNSLGTIQNQIDSKAKLYDVSLPLVKTVRELIQFGENPILLSINNTTSPANGSAALITSGGVFTALSGKQDTIGAGNLLSATFIGNGGITDEEFGFLDTVSSNIQDQLDGKQPTISASNRINASHIGDNNSVSNQEYGFLATVSSNIQNQLNGKQPTITSSNRVNASHIGSNNNISNTEYGYLNGLDGNIQNQLDGKQSNITDAGEIVVDQLKIDTAQNVSNNNSTDAALRIRQGMLLMDCGNTTNNGYTNANGAIQINCRDHGKLRDGISMKASTNNNVCIHFRNTNDGARGRIEGNGSSNVRYRTGSDERLKEDITDMESCWELIKTAKPKSFRWIEEDYYDCGFIAQEIYSIAEFKCLRPRDGYYDCDNSLNTFDEDGYCAYPMESEERIRPHMLDYSNFTPYLWKALQEAIIKIETLETKVAILEEQIIV